MPVTNGWHPVPDPSGWYGPPPPPLAFPNGSAPYPPHHFAPGPPLSPHLPPPHSFQIRPPPPPIHIPPQQPTSFQPSPRTPTEVTEAPKIDDHWKGRIVAPLASAWLPQGSMNLAPRRTVAILTPVQKPEDPQKEKLLLLPPRSYGISPNSDEPGPNFEDEVVVNGASHVRQSWLHFELLLIPLSLPIQSIIFSMTYMYVHEISSGTGINFFNISPNSSRMFALHVSTSVNELLRVDVQNLWAGLCLSRVLVRAT